MAALLNLFRRRKPAPLVCSVGLDVDSHSDHHHTSACFLPFEPLSVLELFQSQGCASCPPALPAIHSGSSGPNTLLLSYNVTLFDHLGWTDTLASSRWDARQRAYARNWGRNNLYTPMVVANGVADGPGAGGKEEIDGLVGRARSEESWSVYLDVNDMGVRVDSDKEVGGDVYEIWLAVYDATGEKVKVKKGVNKGIKMEHKNVVRDLIRAGEWRGGDLTVALPMGRADLPQGCEGVVFLQRVGSGKIITAAKM